ncbi:retrovirus-related pol polyprotein from transposon TNT 1-94 [Tanacetum coccineum]
MGESSEFCQKDHPCPKKNMVSRAVLMMSGLVSVNNARQVNAAHSKTIVNAARPKPKVVVNAARPKVVVNVVKGNNVNVVKASACWVRKSKTKVLDHISKYNSASITLKKFDYIDAQGRSKITDDQIVDAPRHMTGTCPLSYKTIEEIDRRICAFWRNPKEDETSGILKSFKTGIDNLVDHKVKASSTMLADFKLPTTFWAEAVNTACYVPTLSFMRPFGCHVTILNTIDHLGKFDGKANEGFFVGYSLNSKAFRVFNSRTGIVEEKLHIRFSESTPNVVGTKASDNADQARKETKLVKDYILLPLWTAHPPFSQTPKSSDDDGFKPSSNVEKKVNEDPRKESECNDQEKEDNVNNTNNVNIVSSTINAAGTNEDNAKLLVDPNMPTLEDYSIFDLSSDDQ